MAAALVRRRANSEEGAIYPIRLARDLYQIANLIEICFRPSLDSSGRASIVEMKTMSRLGPLLWLFDALEMVGLGLGKGFVWRIGSHVIGNISVYTAGRHPWLGRGWLIANVAVHPDYQRRGIARALMQAAMDLARRLRGNWVALEVESDNQPAISLYRSLGFESFETLSQWDLEHDIGSLPPEELALVWSLRRRRTSDDWAELDLIYHRARLGGMTWTQPLDERSVRETSLSSLVDVSMNERWVLPDPAYPDRLLGSAWIDASGWRRSRVTLFLDPALTDPHARRAFVKQVLELPALRGRTIRLETTAGDPPIEEFLKACGFHQSRSLTQMRYLLSSL